MFAQAGGIPPELSPWTTFGIAGVGLLAFITGWIVSKSTHERALRELDKLAERLAEQDRWMRFDVIPAFTRNTDVLQQVLEILRDQLWRKRD